MVQLVARVNVRPVGNVRWGPYYGQSDRPVETPSPGTAVAATASGAIADAVTGTLHSNVFRDMIDPCRFRTIHP